MFNNPCICGMTYALNLSEFNEHTKDPYHVARLQQIIINCQCGGSYTYSDQHNHFRSNSHKSWQSKDPAFFNQVQYICRCGTIFPYGQKNNHTDNHPTL